MSFSKQKSRNAKTTGERIFVPPGSLNCGLIPPGIDQPIYPRQTISISESDIDSSTIESVSDPSMDDDEDAADLEQEQLAVPKVIMSSATYDAIMEDLSKGPFRREQGGILIGPADAQNIAIRYVKDKNGQGTYASFTIDFEGLNTEIRRVRRQGLICVGIVHSHPDGISNPSGGDISFLRRIFANPKNGGGNGYFFFPIVTGGRLHPYLIDTSDDCRVVPTDLSIV